MTNIWAWVRTTREQLERGEPAERRLAELIHEIPSATADEAHDRVDAMIPEALALARELDQPWVELFLRHWNLQSRVLHRRQAGDELREAVSLLEFGARSTTHSCPQSVCAVQDLAVCYAIRDGPGYVHERLGVARETLARIDPSWSCFDCISAEYFSALLDDRRPAEALTFIEGQIAAAAEHQLLASRSSASHEPAFNMISNRARALLELGRPGPALALLDGIRNVARYGRGRVMSHRQARVSCLLALDRLDEAAALHPPLSAIRATAGHFHDWVMNTAGLIDRGRLANTGAVGRELLDVQRVLERNGARWDASKTALISARLALGRHAVEVARLLLDDYDRMRDGLRRPELLDPQRAELAEQLARAAEPSQPASDPSERALDRLTAVTSRTPDQTLELAAALREIGRADRARVLLEHAAEHATEGPRLTIELAKVLLAERDYEALDALVEPQLATATRMLAWVYGSSLRDRGELDRAIAFDREQLERWPDATGMRLRLAANARARGDWETALAALDGSIDVLAPGDADWDRITAATVLGRWATVRESAARLGITLPDKGTGDQPIEASLGMIRCEFVEPSGRRERYWALRTSPCGARIHEIALPSDPQHYRDRVVFEPVDLDRHLRENENPKHKPCFEVVAILEPGGWRSFTLRGADPGLERFEALSERVREAGFKLERLSSPGRMGPDPRDPEGPEIAIVSVLIAIPLTESSARLRAVIVEAVTDWPEPILDIDGPSNG